MQAWGARQGGFLGPRQIADDPGNIFLTKGIPVLARDDDLRHDLNRKASARVHFFVWRAVGGRTLSAAARRNLGRLLMSELAKETLVAQKIAAGEYSISHCANYCIGIARRRR